jgi:hypothetical protein
MDKTKFVVNPHLDSEGFLMADAHCRGCSPDEMCPRSGHCERYDSPLRFTVSEMYDRMVNTEIGKEVLARMSNPKGWQEVDGVKLPTITWAERTDEELEAAFQEWQQRR